MARVAEGHACLVGALVGAVLQADDSVGGVQLLLGELADILLRLLGPDGSLSELAALWWRNIVVRQGGVERERERG